MTACLWSLSASCADLALAPEPFRAALVRTWQDNPQIKAAGAELRSAQEEINAARSYYGPTASAGASLSTRHSDPESFGSTSGETKTMELEVAQPLYRGGRTVSSVQAAEAMARAAQARLDAVEQKVLLDAATAYADVLRDAQTVELHVNNEKVLERQLDAAQTRLKLGDVGKTDVSQAKAHLAEARASRIRAEGALEGSRAFFEKMTGTAMEGKAEKPTLNIDPPATLDEALTKADRNNPEILAAVFINEADRHDVRVKSGEALPEINLVGSASRTYDPPVGTLDEQDNASLTVRARIQLFSSGRTSARIRQAHAAENQSVAELGEIRRIVREDTIRAWEALNSARAEVKAREAQAAAAREAFDGTEQEVRLGSRTTLDVLDAEQEVLEAETAQVKAEHDELVSFFRLSMLIGDFNHESLALDDMTAEKRG